MNVGDTNIIVGELNKRCYQQVSWGELFKCNSSLTCMMNVCMPVTIVDRSPSPLKGLSSVGCVLHYVLHNRG